MSEDAPSRATNLALDALLRRVESVVDATPGLSRVRSGGFVEPAELRYETSPEAGWSVRIRVRNRRARGRGSRGFYEAQGDGDTPERAVASFEDRLPLFLQVTS